MAPTQNETSKEHKDLDPVATQPPDGESPKSALISEETKGKIVSILIPGALLLGGKLGSWYEKNPYHKFNEGDILVLRNNNICGYGIRPVAVVEKYHAEVGKEGRYTITMQNDSGGSFFEWMDNNTVLPNVERKSQREEHFKWNIENQFKKVPVNTIDHALALYGGNN